MKCPLPDFCLFPFTFYLTKNFFYSLTTSAFLISPLTFESLSI